MTEEAIILLSLKLITTACKVSAWQLYQAHVAVAVLAGLMIPPAVHPPTPHLPPQLEDLIDYTDLITISGQSRAAYVIQWWLYMSSNILRYHCLRGVHMYTTYMYMYCIWHDTHTLRYHSIKLRCNTT